MIRWQVAVLLLATVLSGCGAGARPTPAPSAAPAPPPAPLANACYRLSYPEAVATTAPTAAVVECGQRHTAETFYVGALSTRARGHRLAVDSSRAQAQAGRLCSARLAAFVGGSENDLRLTMLRAVWFTPTIADSDLGADWVRCDLVVVAGADTLASWKGSLRGRLNGGSRPESLAMCGTAAPSEPTFDRQPCSRSNAWRAIDVVELAHGADGAIYPGESTVKEAGATPCAAAGQRVAANALDYQWSYEWPTQAQWDAGQTWGLCWAPTHSR